LLIEYRSKHTKVLPECFVQKTYDNSEAALLREKLKRPKLHRRQGPHVGWRRTKQSSKYLRHSAHIATLENSLLLCPEFDQAFSEKKNAFEVFRHVFSERIMDLMFDTTNDHIEKSNSQWTKSKYYRDIKYVKESYLHTGE